jgi:26S proteasome regulatory subunit N6
MESKQSRLDEAAEAKKTGDIVTAEKIYHEILSRDAGTNEAALREQELALTQLGELYRDQRFLHIASHSDIRQVDKLVELIKTSRNVMSGFAKAKTAKIGRFHLRRSLRSTYSNRLVLCNSQYDSHSN